MFANPQAVRAGQAFAPDPLAPQRAADLSFLIAETGQPGFPGWEAIAALLMAATIVSLVSGAPLWRGRFLRGAAPIVRTVKIGGAKLPSYRVAA